MSIAKILSLLSFFIQKRGFKLLIGTVNIIGSAMPNVKLPGIYKFSFKSSGFLPVEIIILPLAAEAAHCFPRS